MSKNINGIPYIYVEPDSVCSLCGKTAECRPYGVNGTQICFSCGVKNMKETATQAGLQLFGLRGEVLEDFAAAMEREYKSND